jgi:hypothetical protein
VYDYQSVAYARNVFYKPPARIAAFQGDGTYHTTMESFKKALEVYKVLSADGGIVVDTDPVRNAENHDFRLAENSKAINQGARVFVPMSLYEVIAEWSFHRNNTDPAVIIDDHWYVAPYNTVRQYHVFLPRYPLTAKNVGSQDYVRGHLESWTKSALQLNGINQYAVLTNKELTEDIVYPKKNGRQGIVPGSRKITMDMDDNNFIIEAYLKINAGHAGGLIASKAAGTGYVLETAAAGKVRFRLRSDGNDAAKRTSVASVNDGKWHHIIAEVDRSATDGITIYIDGQKSNGAFEGTMPNGSLSNDADFLVGGGPGQAHLAGAIDFMRISRGSLADAKTSIEELYAWQFVNGPHLLDFKGDPIKDGSRDAGAFEGDSTYDPGVPVKEYPITIGKAAQQTVATLKAAATKSVQTGSQSGKSAIANHHYMYHDSVAILLNGSKDNPVTDTFSVKATGIYEYTIEADDKVTFELFDMESGQRVAFAHGISKQRLQVELGENKLYSYQVTVSDNSNAREYHMYTKKIAEK